MTFNRIVLGLQIPKFILICLLALFLCIVFNVHALENGSGFDEMQPVYLLLLDDNATTPPPECIDTGDNDGDRLLNCVETDTGVFVNSNNTGTDPNIADTDGDKIDDGDEVLGTVSGLDLPAMGLNPLKKNILLEYDWFVDSLDCALHSHQPTSAQIAAVTAAFANSPNINPDGSTGITLIHDYGQGGVFSGGNFINDGDGVLVGGVSSTEFMTYKADNFDSNRNGYFHYVILPHRYNITSGSSGQAEINGDDLIVSLQCFLSTSNVSKTIAHELGHNLNLRHGGFENCNHKPNYNSVMNYKYQFPGVDTDCNSTGDSVLDYSRGTNITLNENDLDENDGVCGTTAINWNSTGGIEASVVYNVNSSDSGNCGGSLTVLNDYDDWANIVYTGIYDGDGISLTPVEIISCSNTPTE